MRPTKEAVCIIGCISAPKDLVALEELASVASCVQLLGLAEAFQAANAATLSIRLLLCFDLEQASLNNVQSEPVT